MVDLYDNRLSVTEEEIPFLRLLSQKYKTIEEVCAEIINLQAILNLPKGTEHFISDIHGEYDAFRHVLRNASGVIKDLIERVYGNQLNDEEKKQLAILIYYPEKKLTLIEKSEKDLPSWYRKILLRMIAICRAASSKYTRSKVRKALPSSYAYILEELLHESNHSSDKNDYYEQIINMVIELDRANDFILAMSKLIRRLAIDQLHVIGDIFDRGNRAGKIMEELSQYHSVDIQWGNHDLSWMGAAAGCRALVCNVVRIQAKYATMETLEEEYGINLLPLATFAMKTYGEDSCSCFMPENTTGRSREEILLISRTHKAVAVMQWKCEAKLIDQHPEWGMKDRVWLRCLSEDRKSVMWHGKQYPMKDDYFPTLKSEISLSAEEEDVLDKLVSSFRKSEKLQRHVRFLYTNGGMYLTLNHNLLYHGGLPMTEEGELEEVSFRGRTLSGKAYLDAIEQTVREAYFGRRDSAERQECMDTMWYLWCGAKSPVYLKNTMATFERYFIEDTATHREERNPYYKWRENEKACRLILQNFGLNPDISHIINGHVPVKVKKGERPIKANGKLFVIDGGFAKAYQEKTGIAGYTLIFNSHGLVLVSHEPFISVDDAVEHEKDVVAGTVEYQPSPNRLLVADTDVGMRLKQDIANLTKLLCAYRQGILKEPAK